jgi:hypothetical protein
VRSSRLLAIGLALLLLAGVLAALATSSAKAPQTSTTTVTTRGLTETVTKVEARPGSPLPARVVTQRLLRTVHTPGKTVASAGRIATQTHTVVQTVAGPTRTVTSLVTQTHAVTVAGPTAIVTVQAPAVTVTAQGGSGPPPCTPPPKC